MDLKKRIPTLFREIEVYRSHSLFDEAKEKGRKLEVLLRRNDQIRNQAELLELLAQKFELLENEARQVEAAAASARMTEREQQLVKKLFALSEDTDGDAAALQGASALLVFGQFQEAMGEFNRLMDRESLRLDAAKNILRCHIGLSALDDAVRQYNDWLSGGQLPARELQSIRSFLEDILQKKGMQTSLPKPAEAGSEAQESEAEEFIDILSIQMPSKYRQAGGQDLVLDVAYQRGSAISVILSQRDRALIESFKAGARIDDIQFYSPAVVFQSACRISAIDQIESGPQKGGYALVMQVLYD